MLSIRSGFHTEEKAEADFMRTKFFRKEHPRKWFSEHDQHYPKLGTNGDVSLLNLSKKTRMPKIVDLVVNGMVNRPYSIKPSN
jgi:hypothetical protein